MALVRWQPKNQCVVRDPFDEFFNFDTGHLGWSLFSVLDQGFKKNWRPAIDVSEKDNQINITADLPGIKKEDIQLNSDGTILTIRGERKSEVDKKEKNYHRTERSYGVFERSLDLGTQIDESKVKAQYKDGVLEIAIPRTEKAEAKEIRIE